MKRALTLALVASAPVQAEGLNFQEWNGSIGVSHQRQLVETELMYIMTRLKVDLGSQYYLWQPWFITGDIRFDITNDTTTDLDSERTGNNLGGKFRANILPLSRFPLTMGYSKRTTDITDSINVLNSSGAITPSINSLSTNYFITQQYLGKRFKITATYSDGMNDNDVAGKYYSNKKEIEIVQRSPHNDVNLKAQQSEQHHDRSGEGRDNTLLLLVQRYYPSQEFSITNNVSSVKQHETVNPDDTATIMSYTSNIDQVSSILNWRGNDRKTHVTANIRYTGLVNRGATSSYDNINGQVGAGVRHRFTDALSASASTRYIVSEIDREKKPSYNYSAGVNYQGATREIYRYQYNWSSALTHDYTEDDFTKNSSNSVELSHYASRNWTVGRKDRINFNLDQTFTYRENERADSEETLTQGGRLGYTSSDSGGNQYIQASYNETRQFHGNDLGQQVNVQYSRQQNLSSRSSLTGSLTHQQTIADYSGVYNKSIGNNVLLRYSLVKSFSFQTIDFSSALSVSDIQSNVSGSNSRYAWDNILNHRIGQLSSTITIRTQNIENRQTSSILLSVKRIF